jgi:ribonuclease P protein subunit POP4
MENAVHGNYNNKNIVLHELIGLRAKVVKCLDKKQRGTEGTVIDETKNTLVIASLDGTKRLVKASSTFRFYVDRKAFVVNGLEINSRPCERIEKSMKFYRKREL